MRRTALAAFIAAILVSLVASAAWAKSKEESLGGLMPADKLHNRAVSGNGGKKIGEIESLLIHPESGQVLFVVVKEAGFADLGRRRVPVPWQAFRIDGDGRFALSADASTLDRAPSYRPSELLLYADPSYMSVIYAAWGLSWQDLQSRLAMMNAPGQPGQASAPPGQTSGNASSVAVDDKRLSNVTGSSPAISGPPATESAIPPGPADQRPEQRVGALAGKPFPQDAKPLGGTPGPAPGQEGSTLSVGGIVSAVHETKTDDVPGRLVEVRSGDGVVLVDLGPVKALRERGIDPQPGARILATGTVRQEGGGRIVMAEQAVIDNITVAIDRERTRFGGSQ